MHSRVDSALIIYMMDVSVSKFCLNSKIINILQVNDTHLISRQACL